MKIKDLPHNPKNPSKATPRKLAMLKKALAEFGDLSGVVFNRKSNQLVGGHQRTKVLGENAPITILRRHSKPTKTGTVAEGFIDIKGERFAYREVEWDYTRERAANIAANKRAGEWDMDQLSEWLKDLSSFDLNFDMDLTLFDAAELAALPIPIEVAAHTRKRKDDVEDGKPPRCKAGELYALGGSHLRCGPDELLFCDAVIKRWERQSGMDAVLVTEPKKIAQQRGSSRA